MRKRQKCKKRMQKKLMGCNTQKPLTKPRKTFLIFFIGKNPKKIENLKEYARKVVLAFCGNYLSTKFGNYFFVRTVSI